MPMFHDQAFFGEPISERRTKTPEGFLCIEGNRVARIGVQEYLGSEMGMDDKPNEMIKVYRLPEDVFSEETLLSFNGKILTDNHPPESVTPGNASSYNNGHVQTVRHDDKYIILDVVVVNPILIDSIENGLKVELSAGYSCDYVPYKDGFKQVNIRANHVAVVPKGRAGSKVRLNDSLPAKKGAKKPMNREEVKAAMLAAYVKDGASPDEIAKAIKYMRDEEPEKEREEKEDKKAKDAGEVGEHLGFEAIFKDFVKKHFDKKGKRGKDEDPEEKEKKEEEDAFDAEEKYEEMKKELDALKKDRKGKDKKDSESEEELVEKLLEEEGGEDAESEEEEHEKEEEKEKEGKDKKHAKDALVSLISDLKPVFAKLPPKQQRMMKDACRKHLGQVSSGGTYAEINKAVQSHAKAANDNAPKTVEAKIALVNDGIKEAKARFEKK
jgi:hypothetical protein